MDGSNMSENMVSNTAWVRQAIEVLQKNDMGGYTVPTHGLYPFQWNWDAGFTALGWLLIDEARAWEELEYLFAGQWEDGMVPHIIFHQESDQYFPGPEEWGVNHSPQTTAISQPPVIATIMLILYREAKDTSLAQQKLTELLPKLIRHHLWWFNDRDPENTGMVVSYHPWESGMDNSAAWDLALEAVPRVTRAYQRRDLNHVDSEQRPKDIQYDRYIYLVDLYNRLNFDAKKIYDESPYRVQDISLNAILARANKDLLILCELAKEGSTVDFLKEKQQQLESAIQACWCDEAKLFFSRNTLTNQLIRVKTTAGLLPIYAGCLTPSQKQGLLSEINAWAEECPYGLPSTHPSEENYDPKRYWRGPSWPHVNWMIANGLESYAESDLAEKLRELSLNCIHKSGYMEYFHPESGDGYGGSDFSWTAAMFLYWISRRDELV